MDGRMTRAQVTIMAAIGATLWLVAALLLRAIEPLGALRAPGVMLTYVLVVPGTWPFILLARRLASLRRDQIVPGVAIVTATASLLDANALVWIPALYGADPAAAAAAILWGVGVGLVLALLMAARDGA